MKREEWMSISEKMRKPLQELSMICSQAGLDILSIGVYGSGECFSAFATFIDDDDDQFTAKIRKDGTMRLDENCDEFYLSK